MIDNIQALRAAAALLVVFVHLEAFARVLGLPIVGHGGVDLFFVISGFIMVHTTRARPVGPGPFMLNRLVRIAPIYWLITLAVYAVALVAPSLLQATVADGAQLAKSLAFVPFRKSNGLVQPVLFVGWTLNYEMFFYALFALGLLFRDRRRGALAVVVALGGLVSVGALLRPESVVAEFYTRPIILEFAAGMALAGLGGGARCDSVLGRRAVGLACALGLGAVVLLPLAFPAAPRVLAQGVPATLVAACAIVLHHSGVRWSNRWLLGLGNASYSLYLTHPFVTQATQKVAKSIGLSPAVAAVGALATLALVCVIGALTHQWLEKPLTHLAKQRAERLLGAWGKPRVAPGYARVD
ncbi:MAG TPA: acyltransferase [Polyangiaceae bacterium]|nr:acyltransferase [Polyangiaceae bacterium]